MHSKKVLFICSHNAARSQMAEAFFNELCQKDITAESAGLEAGTLNPFVVKAMNEVGIDISDKSTNCVFDFYKAGHLYTHVITVCDEETHEKCPVFPGATERLHWTFHDPATFTGSDEEILEQVRKVRDAIKARIEAFIKETY